MRNKHANEPNIADILSLLSSLDEDILKAMLGSLACLFLMVYDPFV